MYRCESWTIKKAEWRRIDAFELWCWGRLLRVPWSARRSNQTVLKKGLMLKLKLQYFDHLMWRTDSFEKILILGKIEDRRRRGWQRMSGWMASPTWLTWVWANSRSWWWTGKPGMLQSMGLQRVRHDWATELTDRCVAYSLNLHNDPSPETWLPCLSVKLKYLWLVHGKHPDQAHLWMVVGRKKSTHLQSQTGIRKYLQLMAYFTLSPQVPLFAL